MARKKAVKPEEKQWTKAKWRSFVNVYLNPQEKKWVKENVLGLGECFQFLLDMAEAGYKVSWSYAPGQETHTISLTGQYKETANSGLTMSLRHSDYAVAITALQFCAEEDGMSSDWEARWTTAQGDDW